MAADDEHDLYYRAKVPMGATHKLFYLRPFPFDCSYSIYIYILQIIGVINQLPYLAARTWYLWVY